MKFKLGDKVKDSVTGFQGVATVYAQYLTGCDRVCITPEIALDGTLRVDQWFDIDRVELLQAQGSAWAILPVERGGPTRG